jgi:amino acid transporter
MVYPSNRKLVLFIRFILGNYLCPSSVESQCFETWSVSVLNIISSFMQWITQEDFGTFIHHVLPAILIVYVKMLMVYGEGVRNISSCFICPHCRWCCSWPMMSHLVTLPCCSLFGAMFPLPRIIYAMAMDGLIFRFLGQVHHYYKTPLYGTLIAGLLTGLS